MSKYLNEEISSTLEKKLLKNQSYILIVFRIDPNNKKNSQLNVYSPYADDTFFMSITLGCLAKTFLNRALEFCILKSQNFFSFNDKDQKRSKDFFLKTEAQEELKKYITECINKTVDSAKDPLL